MEQQIRFCTTSDGVRIAYAVVGEGPPVVYVPGWLSHLQFLWSQPNMRAFFEGLAQGRLLVRYDKRGTGLSDWDAPDLSLEAHLGDLAAVADTLGLERFSLVGVSEGGPTAITYAARHSERVSDLILYGSFHRWPHSREDMHPLLALIRSQWAMGSAALSSVFVPSGDPAHVAFITEMQRVSASGETAAKILEANIGVDVTPLLKEIRAPTLVIHRRGDTVAPFKVGREMAALIPDARFQPLEGEHALQWGDTRAVLAAIDAFLREEEIAASKEPAPSGLLTIMFTDMEGSTTLTQRLGDAKARELLREHERIVREALSEHGGSEVKTTGDGFMASFSSATQALGCAIAMQRAFAERNAKLSAHPDPEQSRRVEGRAEPQPSAHGSRASGRADGDVRTTAAGDEAIRVRIGLNAGEPVAENDDLFGTAVIAAARIAALAEGGEILASDVVRQLVAGKGFLFADRGEAALRGFEEPVRLYQVRWEREREGQA